MKISTKRIALVGVLTALYVVCSLTLKIPMGIGAIMLDLGYLVLTVATFTVGCWAGVVGGLGALIESFLFSPYGISYGWIVMNVLIGVICGIFFRQARLKKMRQYLISTAIIIVAVLIGITAKTVIECQLYGIPYLVKIPKSAVAFVVDVIVMLIGLPIAVRVKKFMRRRA